MSGHLEHIVAFLTGIGLAVREAPLGDDTFLPGIRIEHGGLVFDRTRLRWPGDLLHEAGHLAVTPARHRAALDGDVRPEQHYVDGGEVEAIAWSFAAAVRIGLPLAELFHQDGYRGQSQGLATTFALGVYPGAAGLARAGLAAADDDARRGGVAPYPHLQRWLRD
ncbi:MAG: hypothetical protein GXC76_15505 [Rhodanobacteraceae bacterium]|jgi:hypothetical protein|nr:hypothetical protein [Rhodanobacteraceae bacterium]